MHIFLLSLLAFFALNGMEPSQKDRSIFQSLLHKFEKSVDPIPYITDHLSGELSSWILRLNPSHQEHIAFSKEEKVQKNIHMVFEREQKLCSIVEDEINNGSHTRIEQVLNDVKFGYYSPILLSIIAGYQENRLHHAQEIVDKLTREAGYFTRSTNTDSSQSLQNLNPKQNESKKEQNLLSNLSETKLDHQSEAKTLNLSPACLEELILNPNETLTQSWTNYWRKNLTDPIGYLTSSKSNTIADEIILFNPRNIAHKPFTPGLPLHKKLLHNALERISRLLDAVESALGKNDYATVLRLKSNARAEYFSPHLHAIIAGYIAFAAKTQAQDAKARQGAKKLPQPPTQSPPPVPAQPSKPQAKPQDGQQQTQTPK